MHSDVILQAGTTAGYESHGISVQVGRYPTERSDWWLAEI